jgi:hypothetical protein
VAAVTASDATNGDTAGTTASLAIVSVGQSTISMYREGDANHNASAEVSVTLTVKKRSLSVTSVTVADKVYDTTTAATATSAQLDNIVDGDALAVRVVLSSINAVFEDANVGTNKRVVLSGFLLAGAKASSYEITDFPEQSYANITQALPVWASEINAPSASPIAFGQRVSSSTLSGEALGVLGDALPGTLTFASSVDTSEIPALDSLTLAPDGYSYPIVFTPSEEYAQNYCGISGTVRLSVLQAAPFMAAGDDAYPVGSTIFASIPQGSHMTLADSLITGEVVFDLAGAPLATSGTWHWDPSNNGVYEPDIDDPIAQTKTYATNDIFTEPAVFVPDDARVATLARMAQLTVFSPRTHIENAPTIETVVYGDVLDNSLIGQDGVVLAISATGGGEQDISAAGQWSWKNPGSPLTSTTGTQQAVLVFTPDELINWDDPSPSGYLEAEVTIELSLERRSVTVLGLGAEDKVYDGSADADITGLDTCSLNGILPGNEALVSLNTTEATASFDSAKPGTDKTVTITGLVIEGPYANAYDLTQPVLVSATITKAAPVWANDGTEPPTATEISFGEALAASELSGTALGIDGLPIAGAIVWDTPSVVPGDEEHLTDTEGRDVKRDGQYVATARFIPHDTDPVAGGTAAECYDTSLTANIVVSILASVENQVALSTLVGESNTIILPAVTVAPENYDTETIALFEEQFAIAKAMLDEGEYTEAVAEQVLFELNEALAALVHDHPILENSALVTNPITDTGVAVRVAIKGQFESIIRVTFNGRDLDFELGDASVPVPLLLDGRQIGTLSKGSAVIDLSSDFVDGLSNAAHTIEVHFADGHKSGSGVAEISIARSANNSGDDDDDGGSDNSGSDNNSGSTNGGTGGSGNSSGSGSSGANDKSVDETVTETNSDDDTISGGKDSDTNNPTSPGTRSTDRSPSAGTDDNTTQNLGVLIAIGILAALLALAIAGFTIHRIRRRRGEA